ncbi:hypothetical protein Ae201684P_010468 [Aphanomyces euteiches]|nr:hypothetical protein Ae201684P_010468 [Aphanomyces euteiches]
MLANEPKKRHCKPKNRVSSTRSSLSTLPSPASQAAPSIASQGSSQTKQKNYVDDVARARTKLKEIMDDPISNAPTVDEYGDPSWEPVVLSFEPLEDGTDNGQVVIYSLPTETHERTADRIETSITEQICEAGNDIRLRRSIYIGRPTCRIGEDRGEEADLALTPVGLSVDGPILQSSRGFAFPNVVVEIAYKNDSLPRLRAKLARWMSDETSVQVAIGIKIFPTSLNRTAILRLRGPPAQVTHVAFGAPRPGPLQIVFPLALVYTGVNLPASLAGVADAEISIDLIQLRTWIDRFVEEEEAG